MLGDYLFHLDGRDILATRNDQIPCTVAQFDVAIGMPNTDVARLKPPTLKCYSCSSLRHILEKGRFVLPLAPQMFPIAC